MIQEYVNKLIENEDADIVVWTSSNYPAALIGPKSFSWITIELGVTEIHVKSAPLVPVSRWHLITGNFTFKNVVVARSLIETLIADANKKVNSEFFLDSVLKIAIDNGLKVSKINVPNFLSLGTVTELETFKYWANLKWE